MFYKRRVIHPLSSPITELSYFSNFCRMRSLIMAFKLWKWLKLIKTFWTNIVSIFMLFNVRLNIFCRNKAIGAMNSLFLFLKLNWYKKIYHCRLLRILSIIWFLMSTWRRKLWVHRWLISPFIILIFICTWSHQRFNLYSW